MSIKNTAENTDNTSKRKQYWASIKKKRSLLAFLSVLALLATFITLNAGSLDYTIGEVMRALFGFGDANTVIIVQNYRLPRVVAGIVAGLGLAIAGCIMQNNLRNPLASPSTLGIANAAAFGANVAIIVLGGGSVLSTGIGEVVISNPYTVTAVALFFSLLAVGVILALSTIRRFSPESIVLAGVAISSLFAAGTMIIQYFANDSTQIAAVVFWTFGDLSRASWKEIAIMSAVVGVSLVYFLFRRWDYNAIDSGEETAKSLGVNTERIRLGGMFASAVIAAVTVSFLGMIGFIGLVAPQIAKRLIGNDKRFLIPASALVGILVMLVSDTVARTVLSPQTLPVGAITSFLGAPLFLYLLIRREGGARL